MAVEQRRRFEHSLERQLADLLLVLDHERDVVGAYLERGGRAVDATTRVIAKAGIEEPRIVRPQLTGGRVVRRHLSSQRRRHTDCLVRHQQVEVSRAQDDAVAVFAPYRLPIGIGVDG